MCLKHGYISFLEVRGWAGIQAFAVYRPALQIGNQQKCLSTKFSWHLFARLEFMNGYIGLDKGSTLLIVVTSSMDTEWCSRRVNQDKHVWYFSTLQLFSACIIFFIGCSCFCVLSKHQCIFFFSSVYFCSLFLILLVTTTSFGDRCHWFVMHCVKNDLRFFFLEADSYYLLLVEEAFGQASLAKWEAPEVLERNKDIQNV